MHREENRSPEEIVTDEILLLVLFVLASEKSNLESMLKAQKLSFLSAFPLFRQRKKAFSLEFYKYAKGAMSTGVYKAVDTFNAVGFLARDKHILSNPKPEGAKLAMEFREDVLLGKKENAFISDHLDRVAKEFGPYRPPRLTDIVYALKVPTIENPIEHSVRETPDTQHFTLAMDDAEATEKIIIPEDWMDTLAIAFNPRAHSQIIEADKSRTIF